MGHEPRANNLNKSSMNNFGTLIGLTSGQFDQISTKPSIEPRCLVVLRLKLQNLSSKQMKKSILNWNCLFWLIRFDWFSFGSELDRPLLTASVPSPYVKEEGFFSNLNQLISTQKQQPQQHSDAWKMSEPRPHQRKTGRKGKEGYQSWLTMHPSLFNFFVMFPLLVEFLTHSEAKLFFTIEGANICSTPNQ